MNFTEEEIIYTTINQPNQDNREKIIVKYRHSQSFY